MASTANGTASTGALISIILGMMSIVAENMDGDGMVIMSGGGMTGVVTVNILGAM